MCVLMSNDNIETYSIANKEALGKLQEMTEDWISEEEYLSAHSRNKDDNNFLKIGQSGNGGSSNDKSSFASCSSTPQVPGIKISIMPLDPRNV